MARILIIDDEEPIRFSLRGILEDEGYEVLEAATAEEGLEVADAERPDLVFLDIWLPGMDGLTAQARLKGNHPDLPVVMISGHGTIETAVSAIQQGAYDFIEKPLSLEKVVIVAARALEAGSLRRENQVLRTVLPEQDELIGQSPVMLKFQELLARVAPTDVWVLLTGENGTGKELAARALHAGSRRADAPMIAVNCAAIPEELIESELFGHERGAFTDARESRPGKFEAAHGSTLFLDEINSMPLFLQSKLLRVLQDGSFRSLGGSETKRTNVKIIAATNVEPLEAIEKGQLRRDIYYRLSMMSIRIPPLRERKADIGHFVKFYVNKHNGTFHKQVQYVSKDLLKKLEEYDWPGNVRELEHVIVYGMSMVDETSALLQYKDIKGKLLLEKQADRKKTPESLEEVPKLCSSLREAVAAYEEKLIWQALEAAHGNISEAARILDVPRQTLQRKASQLRGEKAKEKQEKEI